EPEHIGADPPGGEGGELHTAARIVALNSLQQTEIALLDQILRFFVQHPVAEGQLDHDAEVGLDEAAADNPIVSHHVGRGESKLFIAGEEWMAANLPQITIELFG